MWFDKVYFKETF